MKFAIAAALFTLATAQTVNDIPSCAMPCLNEAITSKTSCQTTDIPCVCKNIAAVQGAATACVIKACGSDVAINKVVPAAEALCKANSGSSSASGSATGSSGSSSRSASTGSSSGSVATTTAAATTAMAMTTMMTSIPCVSSTMGSMTAAGNQTYPTSVPVAAGAAGLSAGFAAIALAVLAL
ncbi:Extracellular membrane protein, 8-cysteine region, CFEM [Cordyceps militaris CM01]|uniref:Extracellular membrane protein, 8-cysteine region, CFEM n=1 Tax=Cordyceps militaris (strain CM01) TaxID=983644 RepID=G3JSX7_CORMM|nr:Extracellular membrane protein, 8-cysteine region, CFEM [Cordyceps militaris CM01]EGX88973.1 Extracellular membrane protein, 8-cysteine region, CFEM [Cordyceps militaris CM01]